MSGYDLSVSTFSPDGRVFQVEYAQKAIDNLGTSVAFICKDGIIFGTEKYKISERLERGANTQLHKISRQAGVCIGGRGSDGRHLVNRAREEAKNYSNTWGREIPGYVLSDRMGLYVHAYTLGWSVRPFGSAMFIGVKSEHTSDLPELYSIDPSGACYRYHGVSVGKGRQVAKVEMEKLNLKEITCEEALVEVCRILKLAHEESKDRAMEIEIAWMRAEDGYEFKLVGYDELDAAEEKATEVIAAMDKSSDEE